MKKVYINQVGIDIVERQTKKDKAYNAAKKKAIDARVKEYITCGIDKKLARVMAKSEFDCGLINIIVM